MILYVFFQLPFVHDIVCLLSVFQPDNIMTKGKLTKDRQYNGQRETEKTDNIMDKGKLTKDRQYHDQTEAEKRQTISWPKGN
jgi:hypothetical protein